MAEKRGEGTVEEAVELSGLSKNTVRRWVDNYIAIQAGGGNPEAGQLKGRKVKKRRGTGLIRYVDLDAAEVIGKEEATPPP